MKRFIGVLSFMALCLVACAIAFNSTHAQTSGGGVPSDLKVRSATMDLTTLRTNYTDKSQYPLFVGKNQNSRNEAAIINYNTGNASRAGIVVGVDGQGSIAMRGTSNSYVTGISGGPNGAQGLINTGGAVPIVLAVNDTLIWHLKGDTSETETSKPLRIPNGSQSAPSLLVANSTGGSAATGMWSAAAGYLDFSSRGNWIMEIGPSYLATQGTAQFIVVDGSAASPAIAFINNSNDGFYRTGSHTYAAGVNGAAVLNFAAASVTATGLAVTTNVAQGSGLKHQRVTTGSIGATASSVVTLTWTSAFADANYTVNCDVEDTTAAVLSLSVVHVESKVAASVGVRVSNTSADAITGTLNCIAMHD